MLKIRFINDLLIKISMIYVHMRPEVTKYDTTMTTTINKLVLGDDMKTVVW